MKLKHINATSVSAHPMVAELRAIDLRDAGREEIRCDMCQRRGAKWLGGFWLCQWCWHREAAILGKG